MGLLLLGRTEPNELETNTAPSKSAAEFGMFVSILEQTQTLLFFFNQSKIDTFYYIPSKNIYNITTYFIRKVFKLGELSSSQISYLFIYLNLL